MKIFIILLTMTCAILTIAGQNSQADEATRLSAEVVKLYNEKKYKEALPIAEKVVQLRERTLGASDLKTGEALRNLGFLQSVGGARGKAEETLEKAIAVYETKTDLPKKSQSELAEMLQAVAFYKYEDRKFGKSIELFQKAAALNEKIHGPAAPETANILWSLGKIYQYQKDYRNAEKTFRRVLEIRAEKLPHSDWAVQDARNHYHCMSVRNENGDEALTFIESLKAKKTPAGQNQLNSSAKLIRGGVINGKALSLAKPAYPAEARSERAAGAVNVQVAIDETGKVIFACAVSGNKLLYEASERAAFQSTFQPTTLAGKPVKVMGVMVYNFVP